jgi:Transposase IS200 like
VAGTWFPRSHAHLVFVTKYRRDVLDAGMLRRCEDAMRNVCGDFGAELRELNGKDDHVHLLMETVEVGTWWPPTRIIAAILPSPGGSIRCVLRGDPPRSRPLSASAMALRRVADAVAG